MDIKVKMNKGCFYRNEIWFSPAYQRLTIGARDLLQCLYTEINKANIKGNWKEFRNGELSFVESQYTELTGRCKQTYIDSRNLLIEVGFIKMTHRGGACRGDRAMYRVLFADGVHSDHQRWRKYPEPMRYQSPEDSQLGRRRDGRKVRVVEKLFLTLKN